jgi:hypothetical protein
MARIKAIKENIIGKNLARALSSEDVTIVFRRYNQPGSIQNVSGQVKSTV